MALLADRLGLVLQFLAFWLIAPELMGARRLGLLRHAATRTVQAFLVVPVGAGLATLGAALLLRALDADLHSAIRATLVAAVALVAALAAYAVLRREALRHLAERLDDDARFRAGLASMGAALFTVGFALQFAATFGK